MRINHESIRLAYGTVLSAYEVGDGVVWVATTLCEEETYTVMMLPEEW